MCPSDNLDHRTRFVVKMWLVDYIHRMHKFFRRRNGILSILYVYLIISLVKLAVVSVAQTKMMVQIYERHRYGPLLEVVFFVVSCQCVVGFFVILISLNGVHNKRPDAVLPFTTQQISNIPFLISEIGLLIILKAEGTCSDLIFYPLLIYWMVVIAFTVYTVPTVLAYCETEFNQQQ